MKFLLACTIAITAALLLILSSCSEDPGPAGIGLLPARDSVKIINATNTSTYDSSYLYRINGTSGSLLTGLSNGIEARTLLGFTGFAAIPPTEILDSVTLTLVINYRFHDSTGTLAFQVRNILRPFTPATFTWDSLNVPGTFSDTISGTFSQSITPLDSAVTVRLDTTLIRQYISANQGSIMFLPQGSIVAGFSNLANIFINYRPLLTTYYHDSLGTTGSLSLRPAWALFVADGIIPTPPDRITLQAGICDRGILRFDSISVPAKASITQATLQLIADTLQSVTNSFSNDNISASLLLKTVFPYDSVLFSTSLVPGYVNGQKVYQANIRFIVQQWFLSVATRDILLKTAGEPTTLDKLVVFGSRSPAALRPKLLITYSLLP